MDKITTAQTSSGSVPDLHVKICRGEAIKNQAEFSESFTIGRDETCAIQFADEIVSRFHARVQSENGKWWIEDSDSTNGTFLNNQKISRVRLAPDMEIEFGKKGPLVQFLFSQTDSTLPESLSVTHYVEHYFDDNKDETEVGAHTRMLREAFNRVQRKKISKYYITIGIVVFLLLIAGGYAIYQHLQANEQKLLAEEIFYNMKSLELQMAQLQASLDQTTDASSVEKIENYNASRADMEANYDQFVDEMGFYSDKDEIERLILKMARMFGECEINAPEEFITEVRNYIRYWQSTSRYSRAIQRARENGYPEVIVENMLKKHLPPQFFYLALQESDFNPRIVGPQTKYGYAKGIWQFIPSTALQYGLETGPLVELNQYDPRDARYDFKKATAAAANYISDIYKTEAQASGLLVIASYNWGEKNVRNLILKLPANPRERNFWKLLDASKNNLPNETYKYVFYIFSAAVIGENPAQFGFDFKNPLQNIVEDITY